MLKRTFIITISSNPVINVQCALVHYYPAQTHNHLQVNEMNKICWKKITVTCSVDYYCCSRSRRMALGAEGVDRPELLVLSWPLTAEGVSVLRSEAGAKIGTWAGDMGRIRGWNGSERGSFVAKSATGTVEVNIGVGFKTDVENGLKVGVVRRCCCCFCCCSWTMRSAGRRAGDGCGVDSRSRNFTNSSENDWKEQS